MARLPGQLRRGLALRERDLGVDEPVATDDFLANWSPCFMRDPFLAMEKALRRYKSLFFSVRGLYTVLWPSVGKL